LRAMLAAAQADGHEDEAWDALYKHWHPDFRDKLKQALCNGIPAQNGRCAAMACAISVDRTLLAEAFDGLPTSASRIAFLCDLISAHSYYSPIRKAGWRRAIKALDPFFRKIGRALFYGTSSAAPLSSQVVEILQQAAETAPPRILSKILPILIEAGEAPADPIRRWLKETTDKDLAEAAASAAVAIEDEEAIAMALQHPRANARAVALEFLAGRTNAPFPADILALSIDPGRRVRQALVRALMAKPHLKHLHVLLRLTNDTWSDADPSHNEPDSFPIARAGVKALATYAPLPDQISDQLIKVATSTPDRELSQECLGVAACHGSPAIRKNIHAMVNDRDQGRLRLDALNALVFAETIEPELLAPFAAERIMNLSAALATSAVVLVCHHASLETAIALCERMAHSNADRSLAVLGAYVLHDRDPRAAQEILDLLAEGHPARRLFTVEEKLMPASVLDGLGDIKRKRWVHRWLSDRIAKE